MSLRLCPILVCWCIFNSLLLGAPPTAANESISLTEACKLLRADSKARAAFPGAQDYLCGDKVRSEEDCRARGQKSCLTDSVCVRLYGSSNCEPGDKGPCLPDYVYKRCTLAPKPQLAALVRHYGICKRSGGSWERPLGAAGNEGFRYGGVCSCMGSSSDAVAFTMGWVSWNPDRPVSLYVGERGCVLEETLCKEHRGTWIKKEPVRHATELMQQEDCRKKPRSSWKVDPNGYGDCRAPGRMPDQLPEKECKRIAGASWKPYARPFGFCTFEKEPLVGPERFRPFCQVKGAPAHWDELGEQIGFRY